MVYDWLNYDLSRNIAYQITSLSGGTTTVNNSAKASPDGKQYTLSLSVGKDFNREAWTFSPYIRGVYTHVTLRRLRRTHDRHHRPGFGSGHLGRRALVHLRTRRHRRTRQPHVTTDWGVLVPNALVEWNHEFKNDPQTVVTRFLADPTQTPIIVTDPRIDQNYFNLGHRPERDPAGRQVRVPVLRTRDGLFGHPREPALGGYPHRVLMMRMTFRACACRAPRGMLWRPRSMTSMRAAALGEFRTVSSTVLSNP